MSKLASSSAFIRKDMPVAEIVTLCPEAKGVLAEYGLHCFHCDQNAYETLDEGCRSHGFETEEIDELVDDLNQMIDAMPMREERIVVTADAARAIRGVMEEEKRLNEGLAVIVDGTGGFCMEFRPEPDAGEQTFSNQEVPEVRVFASVLTLKRIGGSTIDFREGRFKLDLPAGDAANSSCGCGGSCTCAGEGVRS